jgi:hypothetical protein
MDPKEANLMIKEALDRISALITEDRWQDAHRACLEVLRLDPENIKFIRLKNKIEKNVNAINKKALKVDIQNLEPLFKQGKFNELMPYIKKLQPFAQDYAPLNKFIVQVNAAYRRKIAAEQEQYINDEIKNIHHLASEGKHSEAEKKAENLRAFHFRENELKQIIIKLKTDWVDYALSHNKGLTESDKYEDILLFYQGLLRIDTKSKKLRKLMEKTKKDYQLYKIKIKKEYIYKQIEKIKLFYQQNKYDQAVDYAREVLDIEPSNKEAKALFVKARKKAQKKENQEILEQMKKNRSELKEEYKKNKKGFLKI